MCDWVCFLFCRELDLFVNTGHITQLICPLDVDEYAFDVDIKNNTAELSLFIQFVVPAVTGVKPC